MSDFFSKDEIISYNSISDLSDKVSFYKRNDKLRKKIEIDGRIKYFKLFNELKTTKYILDKSLLNGILKLYFLNSKLLL